KLDINQYDYQKNTPLLIACYLEYLAIIKVLIEGGANVNQLGTTQRCTPLYLTILQGNIEIPLYLLYNGARCDIANADGTSPIHAATHAGKIPILNIIAAKGQSLEIKNHKGIQPIHEAATSGTTKVISALSTLNPSCIDSPVEFNESEAKKIDLLDGATP